MQTTPLFIGGIGPWEIMIILVVALVIFGGRKIPTLARDLGSGIREFRRSLGGAADEISENMNDESTPASNARSSAKKKSAKKTTKS